MIYRYIGPVGTMRVWHYEIPLRGDLLYDSSLTLHRRVVERNADLMYRLTRRERRGPYRLLPLAEAEVAYDHPGVPALPQPDG